MIVRHLANELCLAAAEAEQNLSKDTTFEQFNGVVRMKTTAHLYEPRLPWNKGRSVFHDIRNADEKDWRNVERLLV